MKITTMQFSRPATVQQFYSDLSSPDYVKYQVDLGKEAPALQRRIESLSEEDRQRYATTFASTWNSLSPEARRAVLGGAAGGAFGAGLALTTVSIKQSGEMLGGPVGFVLGVTVMGVIVGAATPTALNHFTETSYRGSVQTPKLWNVVLPQAKLEVTGKPAKTTAARKTKSGGRG